MRQPTHLERRLALSVVTDDEANGSEQQAPSKAGVWGRGKCTRRGKLARNGADDFGAGRGANAPSCRLDAGQSLAWQLGQLTDDTLHDEGRVRDGCCQASAASGHRQGV